MILYYNSEWLLLYSSSRRGKSADFFNFQCSLIDTIFIVIYSKPLISSFVNIWGISSMSFFMSFHPIQHVASLCFTTDLVNFKRNAMLTCVSVEPFINFSLILINLCLHVLALNTAKRVLKDVVLEHLSSFSQLRACCWCKSIIKLPKARPLHKL